MSSSATCLPTAQIQTLLRGDLPPNETAAIEHHLAECEACRCAVEAVIGDDAWWDDARRSLADVAKYLDRADQTSAYEAERRQNNS